MKRGEGEAFSHLQRTASLAPVQHRKYTTRDNMRRRIKKRTGRDVVVVFFLKLLCPVLP